MLGYPDQAVQVSDEKDAHARRLGDAFNLGFALTLRRIRLRLPVRARAASRADASEAERLAREHSVPFINQVMVPQVEGLARLRSGQLV